MFFLGNMHYESTILLTSVYGNIICESIRRACSLWIFEYAMRIIYNPWKSR